MFCWSHLSLVGSAVSLLRAALSRLPTVHKGQSSQPGSQANCNACRIRSSAGLDLWSICPSGWVWPLGPQAHSLQSSARAGYAP